jgi:hypothetical protein
MRDPIKGMSCLPENPAVRMVARTAIMLQMLGVEGAAKWLMEKGVRGEPGQVGACVLAEYFQRQTGERDITVSGDIRVGGWHMPCPPVLKELWGRFDQGLFPGLFGKKVTRAENSVVEMTPEVTQEIEALVEADH